MSEILTREEFETDLSILAAADCARLKALGNAVVPQVAEAIGRAIVAVNATNESKG
jgi:hypothetical protein